MITSVMLKRLMAMLPLGVLENFTAFSTISLRMTERELRAFLLSGKRKE